MKAIITNLEPSFTVQPISIDFERGFHCVTTPSHTKYMGGHEYDSMASIYLYEKVWSRNGIHVQSQLKLAVYQKKWLF